MKVSALVRRYAADRGWHILSVRQPAHLFRRGERRHSRVALPTDPWQAFVADDPFPLLAERESRGIGDTPDAAVLAAIPSDVLRALHRCELAVDALLPSIDNLRDCLQK